MIESFGIVGTESSDGYMGMKGNDIIERFMVVLGTIVKW